MQGRVRQVGQPGGPAHAQPAPRPQRAELAPEVARRRHALQVRIARCVVLFGAVDSDVVDSDVVVWDVVGIGAARQIAVRQRILGSVQPSVRQWVPPKVIHRLSYKGKDS
jgi:hypothetical protein